MKPLNSLTDDEFDHVLRRAVASLPDAPETMLKAAIGLFPAAVQAAPRTSARTSLLQSAFEAVRERLEAVLSFDSWATPALASGMRSASASTRFMLFSVQGRDIDLRIAPEAGGFSLAGQILGPDEAGRIELSSMHEGALTQVAALDEMGEFRIDGVARGSYRVTVHVGADQIVLPQLEVGDRPV